MRDTNQNGKRDQETNAERLGTVGTQRPTREAKAERDFLNHQQERGTRDEVRDTERHQKKGQRERNDVMEWMRHISYPTEEPAEVHARCCISAINQKQ